MSEASDKTSWILEADEATFEQAVIERSRELPVLVDFWAPWCQPCRMLGPILEKLAKEYDGKFLLAKADTDKMPNVAASFNVQSIPAVYAVRNGQLADFFVGLLGEEQIRGFIDRLLPSEAESLVARADKLHSSDAKAAEADYREAARLDPNLAAAKIGLAGLLLDQNRAEECQAIVGELEQRGFLEPEAEKLKSRLALSASSAGGIDLDALRAAASADSADPQARLNLAEALAAHAEYPEALEIALSVVQTGKKEVVEPARKLMVDVFNMLPADSDIVTEYRRRLSTALY